MLSASEVLAAILERPTDIDHVRSLVTDALGNSVARAEPFGAGLCPMPGPRHQTGRSLPLWNGSRRMRHAGAAIHQGAASLQPTRLSVALNQSSNHTGSCECTKEIGYAYISTRPCGCSRDGGHPRQRPAIGYLSGLRRAAGRWRGKLAGHGTAGCRRGEFAGHGTAGCRRGKLAGHGTAGCRRGELAGHGTASCRRGKLARTWTACCRNALLESDGDRHRDRAGGAPSWRSVRFALHLIV